MVGRGESVVILAQREDRVRNLVVLGTLVVWMVYTRVFWGLYAAHATLPPCPFLRLTGHPCPFCGGTRSFAYMWRGDVAHAIQIYPLGPVLFVATLVAIPVLVWVMLTRRDVHIPMRLFRVGMGIAVVALAISWALKLTVLPN